MPEDVDGELRRVPKRVMSDRDVVYDRPRCITVLIPWCQQQHDPGLRLRPVAVEDIVFYYYVHCVLELERILDYWCWDLCPPLWTLEHCVPCEVYIGRDHVRDVDMVSAREKILPCAFEEVVRDDVWTRTVVDPDSLDLTAGTVIVLDATVRECELPTVQCEAAQRAGGWSYDYDVRERDVVRLRINARCVVVSNYDTLVDPTLDPSAVERKVV